MIYDDLLQGRLLVYCWHYWAKIFVIFNVIYWK